MQQISGSRHCSACKQLDLLPVQCNTCESWFCSLHRVPISHGCDYKAARGDSKRGSGSGSSSGSGLGYSSMMPTFTQPIHTIQSQGGIRQAHATHRVDVSHLTHRVDVSHLTSRQSNSPSQQSSSPVRQQSRQNHSIIPIQTEVKDDAKIADNPTSFAAWKSSPTGFRKWVIVEHGLDGMSAGTICAFMNGNRVQNKSFPWDYDDFALCQRELFDHPTWRSRMRELGVVSTYWDEISAVWPQLEQLYFAELERLWDGVKPQRVEFYAAYREFNHVLAQAIERGRIREGYVSGKWTQEYSFATWQDYHAHLRDNGMAGRGVLSAQDICVEFMVRQGSIHVGAFLRLIGQYAYDA